MFASHDEHTMLDASYDSTPFTTAFVLHTLGLIDSGVEEMIESGLRFLTAEEESGLWRYWSRSDSKHSSIPPDMDDTCCASQALRLFGRTPPDNKSAVSANADSEGRFYSWFVPRPSAPAWLNDNVLSVAGTESAFRLYASGLADNVDCAINANVILYLGESAPTPTPRLLSVRAAGLSSEDSRLGLMVTVATGAAC